MKKDVFYNKLEFDKYYFNGMLYVMAVIMIIVLGFAIYELCKGQACDINTVIGQLIIVVVCISGLFTLHTKVYFLDKLITMKNLEDKEK